MMKFEVGWYHLCGVFHQSSSSTSSPDLGNSDLRSSFLTTTTGFDSKKKVVQQKNLLGSISDCCGLGHRPFRGCSFICETFRGFESTVLCIFRGIFSASTKPQSLQTHPR